MRNASSKRSVLSVNVTANEILFPAASIQVTSSRPLDPDSVQGGIVVRGVHGSARLARGGRAVTWCAAEALPPGHHTLIIDGLLEKGHRHRLGERMETIQTV